MKQVKVLKQVRYGVELGKYIRKFPDEEIKNFCSKPVIEIYKEKELAFDQREELTGEEKYFPQMLKKFTLSTKGCDVFIEDKTLRGERWSKYECVKALQNFVLSPYFNSLNFIYVTIDGKLFLELDNYADEKLGIKGE